MHYVMPLLIFYLLAAAGLAQAESPVMDCAPDGIAVGGFDLVSYHQGATPRPGKAEFAIVSDDLTYLFSSSENQAIFRNDMGKYLPVYNGWCATTLAMGRLACPDYTNFKIEDGRLLLFELAGFTNGRSLWNSDPVGFRVRADTNFEALVQ